MTKVMVIGNAAGGKSTLCKQLSQRCALPYHSIDAIQWQPGWIQTPEADYDRKHSEIIRQDTWLIDGFGSWKSLLCRMDAADTIILVDHPLWRHYWWATKRQIFSFLGRANEVSGCRLWPVTLRLFGMIWRLHFKHRQHLIDEAYSRADTVRVLHITSPRQLARLVRDPYDHAQFGARL